MKRPHKKTMFRVQEHNALIRCNGKCSASRLDRTAGRVPKMGSNRPMLDRRYKARDWCRPHPIQRQEHNALIVLCPDKVSASSSILDIKPKVITRRNIFKRRCNASEMVPPMLDRITTNSQGYRFRKKIWIALSVIA